MIQAGWQPGTVSICCHVSVIEFIIEKSRRGEVKEMIWSSLQQRGKHKHCLEDLKVRKLPDNNRGVLPYGIKGSDGMFPLPLHGLASDEILCKVVRQLAGFPHESVVLQVFTGYLLVDVLEAHEKSPVAKPETSSGRQKDTVL